MKRFDPKYYINDTDSKDNPRVNQIISKCEDAGAKSKTKDEAAGVVKGLPANERYELGKQTLYIKELKRSFVHFFNTPKGSLESPQLIINHGMICPHSCQYCYWQKDIFQSSRVVIFANPKERFETDLKNAMAIWRVFSALLKIPACADKVNDKTFSQFDKRIKNIKEKAADTDLNEVCYNLAEKMLSKWGIQDVDIQFFKGLFEDQDYNPKVIFNSGENNDSVAHEHITDVQKDILIPTVFSLDNAYLMLRTKSIHYDFLEQFKDHEKKDRIIISPSLIPQEFIEKYESGNYSLEERLKTLKKVSDWGFKIFPCFSPLFYTGKSWAIIIENFIKIFNEYLPPDKIQYYTLGTLRLSRTAIRNIRLIHPDTDLATSYLVKPKHTSGDKFRYPKIIRIKMYAYFIRQMKKYGYEKIPRFLQTETIEAWKALTAEKYSDLGLDLGKYLSGEMDVEALAGIERAKGKGKVTKVKKTNKRFKGWEKVKFKAEDGLVKKASAPIIISASRTTDLPAFYSDWFMERLRKGYIVKRLPRNPKKTEHISFSNTRLIVFWTKNPKPMFQYLNEIEQMGIDYYFQYTLNDYEGDDLEPNVPPLKERIDYFKALSKRIGKERVIWRFDPLILTGLITREKLIEKVHGIMSQLSGFTEKLVISFMKASKHKKVVNNLNKAGIKYRDFTTDEIDYIASYLAKMGKEFGVEVAACAEEFNLSSYGIAPNKCIDDGLIKRVFSQDDSLMEFIGDGKGLKDIGQRPLCRCIVSKDIGEYHTCKHLCRYCYANVSEKIVNRNVKIITQTGEMLLPKTVKVITDDGVEKETIAVKMYDRNRHYELTSALQKSIRWCEVNESRYFARQLMDMGIPGAVFNRLIIIAAEDVGLADPSLIVYERQCSDHFEKWIKQNKIKKSEAVKFPELCEIVDRAVIAAAISYKSRLLPQLSFATLFDIYQQEDFSENLLEYLRRFVVALKNRDEKQALYYAYVVDILFDSKNQILTIIQGLSGMRNKDLIQKWVEEYKREYERLMLAGSIVLLCRDLKYPHGEYNDAVYQYLSVPIKKAEIPDRAYDMHTSAGARKGRGLEHFFDEGATVKNERFPNNWEQAGRTAYFSADQKGLARAVKIIEAIKKKL